MRRSRTHVPRPVLFVLVYGIFLVIVGVTATAQTMMVSANFSTSTLQSVVGTDAGLIRSVVNTYVLPGDLDGDGPSATRRADLEADLARLVRRAEILRVELLRPDGTVIASDRSDVSGLAAPTSADFLSAAEGRTVAAGIARVAQSEAAGPALETASVLREYFPLQADGQVKAVVGVWRDAVPILAELDRLRTDIVVTTLTAAIAAAGPGLEQRHRGDCQQGRHRIGVLGVEADPRADADRQALRRVELKGPIGQPDP